MHHALILVLALAEGAFAPDQELYVRAAQAFERGDFVTAAMVFRDLLVRHPSSSLVCPTHYALAETYYSLQHYDKALAELGQVDTACETRVGRGRIRWRQAWALYQLGRLAEAKEAFRLASTSPDLPPGDQSAALVMAGDVAMDLGNPQEALSTYRRLVREGVPTPLLCQVQYKIGRVCMQQGSLGEAIAAFSSVLQLDPSSEFADDAAYGKAWALRMQKKHDAARLAWQALITTYPTSPLVPEARFRMGEEYYRLGKYPEAILSFDSVPQTSDFADDAMYWKAWAEYRLGQFAKAAYTFSLLRTAFPGSRLATDAQFRAAEAHRESGEYELAMRGYRVVVEMKPSDDYLVRSLYGLAQSAAFSGDQALAESYRTQLLATGKAGDYAPRASFDLGVAAYNRKQYGRAIREFTSMLSQHPTHPLASEAWFRLGMSYLREERFADAKEAFLRCLRRADADLAAEASYQLGWVYFRSGEFGRAAEQFMEVSTRGGPRAADARYRAGDALYNAGRYAEAIAIYEQVIELHPGSELAATAQNSIGWCYERMGRTIEAIGAFQVVVQRYARSAVWDDSAFRVAEYYHAARDYALSIPVLELLRAARSSPFWESGLLMLAEGLWRVGRKREARGALEELLRQPEAMLRPEALLFLAEMSWEDHDLEGARARYQQFADEFPTHELAPKALLRVAESYATQERWDLAHAAFSHAAVAGADRASCLSGTCRASAMLGRCAEAEEAARQLEVSFPTDPRAGEAQFWAGNCYALKGDDETATRLLLKVPILYPDSEHADDALLQAARARLRQGRKDQAASHLRRLLEAYPGSDLRPHAEKLLASLGGRP